MIDLKTNKSFCILPFIHVHVSEKNDLKLCCAAEDDVGIQKYHKDFDFANDPGLQKIRAQMLAGERIPHCKKCYEYEDGGADSTRIRDTVEWFDKLKITDPAEFEPRLIYYDIRNDNLCNLSCRMCNPQFSSQLSKEYKSIGWIWDHDNEPKSFGFNTVVDMETVQKIYVAGGEPSLMPEFRTFLKRAIESGRTDIDIRMNTNATNLNQEYRELLSHFSNLDIICSIDGYDQVNKYIRWPADWPTLIENIKGLHEITPRIAFNVTVSIWNISNLSKLVDFFEKNFPTSMILLNKVMHPPEQMPDAFPDKKVALRDLSKLRNSKSYIKDPSFKSKVDFLIDDVCRTVPSLETIGRFFKFNDALDQSRGVKLVDYIPELEKARLLLPKK